MDILYVLNGIYSIPFGVGDRDCTLMVFYL